jgi:hypothetical protein
MRRYKESFETCNTSALLNEEKFPLLFINFKLLKNFI